MEMRHHDSSPVLPRMVTTANGPVQYAERGTGQPVLVLHGSPGGVDACEYMTRFLPEDQFRVIMLSRPGYLRTPLASGPSIDAQADLAVALLDHLDIERASVFSLSGGGPAGYRLAVRHPRRVQALLAVSALSGHYVEPPARWPDKVLRESLVGRQALQWLGARRPKEFVFNILAAEGHCSTQTLHGDIRRVLQEPGQLEWLRGFVHTSIVTGRRRSGYRNDVAWFERTRDLDLHRITCPTMVIHGDSDAEVALDHALRAIDSIPHCDGLILPEGSHLALYVHSDAQHAQGRAARALLAGNGA